MRPVLAALALLLLPLAAAQDPGAGAPGDAARAAQQVTFYAHIFSFGPQQPMPGNTQYPIGEEDFSRGALQVQPCMGEAMCGGFETTLLYLYSTAGLVNADFDTWTYEDFHNERGQAKDILLDAAGDVTATVYLSADAHRWFVLCQNLVPGIPNPYPCWDWDPGFVPQVQVEATLFLANMGEYQGQASEPPPVHQKVGSGDVTVVAQGVSAPMDILSLDANLNGGQGEVYEFQVNLGPPQVEAIPKESDWVLRFRWWSVVNGERSIVPTPMDTNLNSGEFYPVRFTMPVRNAFDVELVYPQFLHDKLLLHAMLNSPWGSYDVDPRSVELEVRQQGGGGVQPRAIALSADYSVAHGGHYKPINLTWVWDHRADALPMGRYDASVAACNFQRSACSATTASFEVLASGEGRVLSVGRSGQQTFTDGQLRSLGEPR